MFAAVSGGGVAGSAPVYADRPENGENTAVGWRSQPTRMSAGIGWPSDPLARSGVIVLPSTIQAAQPSEHGNAGKAFS